MTRTRDLPEIAELTDISDHPEPVLIRQNSSPEPHLPSLEPSSPESASESDPEVSVRSRLTRAAEITLLQNLIGLGPSGLVAARAITQTTDLSQPLTYGPLSRDDIFSPPPTASQHLQNLLETSNRLTDPFPTHAEVIKY